MTERNRGYTDSGYRLLYSVRILRINCVYRGCGISEAESRVRFRQPLIQSLIPGDSVVKSDVIDHIPRNRSKGEDGQIPSLLASNAYWKINQLNSRF